MSVIYGTTGVAGVSCRLSWSAVEESCMKTFLHVSLDYKIDDENLATNDPSVFTITINGETETLRREESYFGGEGWFNVLAFSKIIPHNPSTGEASAVISATGSIPTMGLETPSFGTTIQLDKFAASTIQSVESVTLGSLCNVKWQRANWGYTYRLKFSIGEWSYTTDEIIPSAAIMVCTYTGYEVPLETANWIAANSTTGEMSVTLLSFYEGTQHNDTSTKTFLVTIPDNDDTKPTAKMLMKPINPNLSNKFEGIFVKGRSMVDVDFTDGAGKYGAKVESYSMSVQGQKHLSPFISDYLQTAGEIKVTGTVTDTRGFSRIYTETINVIEYEAPKLLPLKGTNSIVCKRCDESGKIDESGSYLKITARRDYHKVIADGVQKNYCRMLYRYKPEAASDFSEWKILLGTQDSDVLDSAPIADVVSSPMVAYVIQLGVFDDVGETAVLQFIVPTNRVQLHFAKGGRRIGLFRYASEETEDGIDVGAPIHGGSVDNLTIGTKLDESIDLDDIKTEGNYYSPNKECSETIANSPYTEGGFGLIVRQVNSKIRVRQELYYDVVNWCRNWDGEKWSAWFKTTHHSLQEQGVLDYVLESGSFGASEGCADGEWHYKKWKNGTFEMHGVFLLTGVFEGYDERVAEDGWTCCSKDVNIKSPFNLSSACVCGTPDGYYWLTSGNISEDKEHVRFNLVSNTDIVSNSNDGDVENAVIRVGLVVMGKYA